MIKKLLFVIGIAAAGFSANAQVCVPNISCLPGTATYGVCPDSATGLAIGTVGVPYNQTVSFKIPTNGADFGYPTATVVSIDITGVDSLAPGLTYQCAPSSCSFPGGSNGCILISGTPTTVWNKQVIVKADAHGTIFGVPLTLPQENKQYRSIVIPASGIVDLDMTKFDVQQNAPNPFADKTEIYFSVLNDAQVEFKVYNLLGAVLCDNKFQAQKGANIIKIDANSFAPGVYIYSVKNGDKVITKRMVVSEKK
jgi:hypothetical protein